MRRWHRVRRRESARRHQTLAEQQPAPALSLSQAERAPTRPLGSLPGWTISTSQPRRNHHGAGLHVRAAAAADLTWLERDCRLAGEAGVGHDVIVALDALAWDDLGKGGGGLGGDARPVVEIVRSRRQLETDVRFCSGRIVSSDPASTTLWHVRAIRAKRVFGRRHRDTRATRRAGPRQPWSWNSGLTALGPGAAVSWPARSWLLWWPSGRAVAACEDCSDSSRAQ